MSNYIVSKKRKKRQAHDKETGGYSFVVKMECLKPKAVG